MIKIFTDGSCLGNRSEDGNEIQTSGSEPDTTNNRMEMTAAVRALSVLPSSEIELYTDSKYVIDGITSWIHGWQRRGWKTSANKDVLNKDLWLELLAATQGHSIKWCWVKGHSGHRDNERVDALANAAAKRA